ncbi:MAG: hypothetical protein QXT06_06160 [Candidatus Bathyarchaeia archaeon]
MKLDKKKLAIIVAIIVASFTLYYTLITFFPNAKTQQEEQTQQEITPAENDNLHVIPQIPIGAMAALIACFLALGLKHAIKIILK